MSREIIGVILAGGRSRRMGKDKAFLEMGGVSFVERIVKTLSPKFLTIAIVSKELQKFQSLRGVYLVQDLFQEQHTLGGITSALSHFRGKDCFIFACDLPFLNPDLIQLMIQRRNGYDVLIPRSRHGLESLHAIYTGKCLAAMKSAVHQGEWGLERFIRKMRFGIVEPETLHRFDPEELSFLNVNTPAELKRAREIEIEPQRRH